MGKKYLSKSFETFHLETEAYVERYPELKEAIDLTHNMFSEIDDIYEKILAI